MTDRPIIFSAPMITALLAGNKTQTRRLATSPLRKCEPGDMLYVRENFWHLRGPEEDHQSIYWDQSFLWPGGSEHLRELGYRRRPSIHMPRWASRLTLAVRAVRIEKLHAISEADAWAEGMPEPYLGDGDPPFEDRASIITRRKQFRNLWRQLHGSESWNENPEVVVLTFSVEKRNIDRLAA